MHTVRALTKPNVHKIKGSKMLDTLRAVHTVAGPTATMEQRTTALTPKIMRNIMRTILSTHQSQREQMLRLVVALARAADAGVTQQLLIEAGILPTLVMLLAPPVKAKGLFGCTWQTAGSTFDVRTVCRLTIVEYIWH